MAAIAAARTEEAKAEAQAQKKYQAELERIRLENEAAKASAAAAAFAQAKAAGEAIVARQAEEAKRLRDEAEAKSQKAQDKKHKRRALRAKFYAWFLKLKTWQKLSAIALTVGLIAGASGGVAVAVGGVGEALARQAISDRIHTQQMDFKAYLEDKQAFANASAAAQPVLDQANALNPIAQQWGDEESQRTALTKNIETMTTAITARDTGTIEKMTTALGSDMKALGTQDDADQRAAVKAAAAAAQAAAQAKVDMKLGAQKIMLDMWTTKCTTYETMSLYNSFAYWDGPDIVWVFSHNPNGNVPEFTLRMQDGGSYWHVFMNGDSAIQKEVFIQDGPSNVNCPDTNYPK